MKVILETKTVEYLVRKEPCCNSMKTQVHYFQVTSAAISSGRMERCVRCNGLPMTHCPFCGKEIVFEIQERAGGLFQ